MVGAEELDRVVRACDEQVHLAAARPSPTRRVPERYREHFGLPLWRPRAELPPASQQHTVTGFLANIEPSGVEAFAAGVLRNRQRTSTRNGIPKAETARRFAGALAEHGIERLQDVTAAATSRQLEAAMRAIPGQRIGISLTYFFMLAGSDDLVKPDRMLDRFLHGCLRREVGPEETQELLTAATTRLRVRYPQLTPSLLDQAIWQQQRSIAARRGLLPA